MFTHLEGVEERCGVGKVVHVRPRNQRDADDGNAVLEGRNKLEEDPAIRWRHEIMGDVRAHVTRMRSRVTFRNLEHNTMGARGRVLIG